MRHAFVALVAAAAVSQRRARAQSAAPSLKIRGVNLGGWLVLEKWIKPSLFSDWDRLDKKAPKDQWTFCETLGPTECKRRLETHWDTWVTEETISDLSKAGITHVRIPVGHWITCDIADDEPYVCGEWKYLQRAAEWCAKYDVKVWLDLHTAPGSQNGFDNSGHFGVATWDKSMANVNRTVAVVAAMSQRVAEDEALSAVVTGFGLLNEPDQHIDYWRMLKYYEVAYATIREILGKDVAVYVGDMFNPQSFNWFWVSAENAPQGPSNEAENVFLDSHIYACFVDDLKAMTPAQHILQVCKFERDHINQCCWDGLPPKATELKRFVGEWTAAYDQTPSPELELHFQKHPRALDAERFRFLEQYVLAQMMTYEATPAASAPYLPKGAVAGDFHGWFFWNFRMEEDVYREWDYLRGWREGWIPTLQRGVTVEDQTGLTCRDLEEQALGCTDDVVEPFPKIPHWKGVPCRRPTRLEAGASLALRFLALVGSGVVLLALAYGAFCGMKRCLARCEASMGYAPLNVELGRRKDFTRIADHPPPTDMNNPIQSVA
mmetsp:Transcript_7556/g.22405  ORF Transcript_7556/g.22405 Transcript_7556/m.22405 type:complete len:548 (-) Transcript_7556:43-1686(-)|eukprot:CAMPEP_0119259406 /NCGR_PEP_ID=MMETSP1329-20130426/238_1 /TAXON_ID=114041 /ORGANISM="Genus nov. species nov., Strain RCC1024" /LENGTH=547 /DNA_ID=CAMNT_0007258789 /DNA_START=170 /DNA_END=1813 /DNA_ORIENTATION=+